MPNKFLKKFMPSQREIKNNKTLRIFGDLLHDPNLWHMNRRSIAGAFGVGLFFAWWPVPFQMMLAAGGAIWLRTNLPLSVALVWITNPVTMPAMFYSAYIVGTWIIGAPIIDFEIEHSLEWLIHGMAAIWKPLLIGCLTVATISSVLGYFSVSFIWRYSVLKRRERKKLNNPSS